MKTLFRRSAIAAFACSPTVALAAAVDPDRLDLKIAPGDGAAVQADANLNAGLSQFQSTLHFTIGADPKLPAGDPFHQMASAAASREGVDFKAAWNTPEAGRLDLSLTDVLGQTWRATALGLVNDHQVNTEDRGASAGLTLAPLKVLNLSLTAAVTQKTVLDIASAAIAAPEPHSQLSLATDSVGAGAKWRLTPWFSLDASGKIETAGAVWRGAPAGGAQTGSSVSYVYFEPAVTGVLSTPGQGHLGLTFEHAVSPIDAGAFAAFAAIEDRAAEARIGPNREWRYRLRFDQTLAGDLKLSAALTQARIENATELGPVGPDLQAPVSVTGGQRQEMDVSLSTPLTVLGLPTFTLTGAGAWRSSQVRDPFTGEIRRASAESPRTASLDLVQSLARGAARWGLQGRFGGDQSLYQMSQVTTVSVADSLGGFVEYSPGPMAVRLQIDGLYGGGRTATDLFYAGPRATAPIDRVDRHAEDGQAVRLILSKAL